MNDSWQEMTELGRTRYVLPHQHSPYCRFGDAQNPLHVIAYEQDWVEARMHEAGLVVESVHLGNWAGRDSPRLQDIVVFHRQGRFSAARHLVTGRLMAGRET